MSKLTQEMIAQALRDYNEALVKEIPNEDEIDLEFSPEFERKMKRLIRKTDHPARHYGRMVASFALAALMVVGVWFTMEMDSQADFFGWVREKYETVAHFFFEGDANKLPPEDVEYRLTWLPDGYVESNVLDERTATTIIYKNQDNISLHFRYGKSMESNNFFVDTNHELHKSVQVNGTPAEFYASTDSETYPVLIWQDKEKGTIFALSGAMDENTLLKIAENVE